MSPAFRITAEGLRFGERESEVITIEHLEELLEQAKSKKKDAERRKASPVSFTATNQPGKVDVLVTQGGDAMVIHNVDGRQLLESLQGALGEAQTPEWLERFAQKQLKEIDKEKAVKNLHSNGTLDPIPR